MKRIILPLLLGMLVAVTADAQFNIGSLVNQGKKKVKEKVEKTIEKKANSVLGTTVQGNFSAPAASSTGRDVDPQLFPYDKQQFAGTGVYTDGTEAVENFLLYTYVELCKILNANEGVHKAIINGCCPVAPGGKVLAYGEPLVNAFFYDYFQNPNDYKNYRQMIKAYIVAHNYGFKFLEQNMVEGSTTQMTDSEGKVQTLWEDENNRIVRNQRLLRSAQELAAQSDYANIFDGTYSIYTQADKAYKAGNKIAAYNNYRELDFAWRNFLTKHPSWQQDSRAGQFTQMYNAAMQTYRKLRDEVIDVNKVPQDMPPTYKAIAGIEGKIRQCIAAEDPEHKNAPIVYLSSGWRPLYRSGGNLIDSRAVDVGWTYTDAKGQKWLAYTTLMQKAAYKGLTVTYLDSYGFSGGYKTMKLK